MKKYKVYVNGEAFEVIVEGLNNFNDAEAASEISLPTVQQKKAVKTLDTSLNKPQDDQDSFKEQLTFGNSFPVAAPMPGLVLNVKVKVGERINEGDVLLILEAMKMENEITAPTSGSIKSINVAEGSTVNTGDIMVIIE